jgi:uncharacterized protein with HEPN domain
MRLESKKYLYDIARAAALAMEFVKGKNFADYTSDAMLAVGCGASVGNRGRGTRPVSQD